MASNWTLPSTSGAAAGITAKIVENATEMAKNFAALDGATGETSIECTKSQAKANYDMMTEQADAKRDSGIGEIIGAVGQGASEVVGYAVSDLALEKNGDYKTATTKLKSLENCEEMLNGKDLPDAVFKFQQKDNNQDPNAIGLKALPQKNRTPEEHLKCLENWKPKKDGLSKDVAESAKYFLNEHPKDGSHAAQAQNIMNEHAKTITKAKKEMNDKISNIKSGYSQRGERTKNIVAASRGIAVGSAQQQVAVDEKNAAEDKLNETNAQLSKDIVQRGQKTAEEAERSALDLMRMATDIQGEVRRHQAG